MKRDYSRQTARQKIKRVFQYLKELHLIKTPPVLEVEKYEWLFWLDSLPVLPSILRGADFSNMRLQGLAADPPRVKGENFIIRVSRPQETECPEPGVVLKNWLKPGYAHVGAEPKEFLRARYQPEEGKEEEFESVPERVSAFDDWLNEKRKWEISEKKILDALGAFEDLFDLYGKISRESEKYQLYAADGILVRKTDGIAVKHPLLLQRVSLEFHASVPEFTLRDSDDPPEIYTNLLRYLGVESATLKLVKDSLREGHQHPFGAEETSQFLTDTIQRLWRDGQYFDNEFGARDATSDTYIYRKPHIFLGLRNYGFSESIERYIEAISKAEDFPESLLRLVGIDTGERQKIEPGALDLLLTKPANAEQERVLYRLAETGAVLVQGPPGTGKSHTIANLIGHLLAQDKSILVTSHTSKALRVVRQHVSQPLQSLCVSVLQEDEDNNKQLEESINGILNYISSSSQSKLQTKIDKLEEKRKALKGEYHATLENLLRAAEEEYRELECGSKRMSPSQAARWVNANAQKNDWIPGPLEEDSTLPLTSSEVKSLYELNVAVAPEDEELLASQLPEKHKLPTPDAFVKHFNGLKQFEKSNLSSGSEFWRDDKQDSKTLQRLMQLVTDAGKVFDKDQKWINEFLEIGRQTEKERRPWFDLIAEIEQYAHEIPELEALVLSHGPRFEGVQSTQDEEANLATCKAIIAYLESGKTLKTFSKLLHRSWAPFLATAKIESGTPSRPTHFKAIAALLEMRIKRRILLERWQRMMAVLNNDPLEGESPGKRPEKTLLKIAAKMRDALKWYEQEWGVARDELTAMGFEWDKFLHKSHILKKGEDEHGALRVAIESLLVPILNVRIEHTHWKDLERVQEAWVKHLDGFDRKGASQALIKQFRSAIRRVDIDQYRQAWETLLRLDDLQKDFAKRAGLIEKLKPVAPEWAARIEKRDGVHGQREVPGNPEDAWSHRLWEQLLAKSAGVDLDQLQQDLNSLQGKIHQVTAEFVEARSWIAQIRRTGLEQQQALNGWLGLNRKIGKGTGKHVLELKEEAKNTLARCREAVPVWIMPLSRVVESFDVASQQFDVVIIDEASQCDVLGLIAFAMAKEVIVVGDHEQVSPYAVGFRTDQIHDLMDEILVDIPNNRLYDAKTSVYDLARQSFGGNIRLVEHFRCVPDIIQFSNQLCYNGEIRALREASAGKIRPALVSRHVAGEEKNKINQEEALELASLILAITRFDEYADCSIGVISMVGTEQAVYIDSILRRRLTVTEYKSRRILCGNAAQFQGDERDIIFISMVNSPSKEGKALHLRTRDDATKVFNVAASRARDQLWVIHSLNPEGDLKHNDLRLMLIHHAANAGRPKNGESQAEPVLRLGSELERQMLERLQEEKFQTLVGVPVGEFLIDLVVVGRKGNRVAVQCDGDRIISREDLETTLNRQMTLERLGWKFIRVRGSEFLRRPDETFAKIKRRLKNLDIQPLGLLDGNPEKSAQKNAAEEKELLDQVIKRAEMIRARWKDIPSVSSVLSRASGGSPPGD